MAAQESREKYLKWVWLLFAITIVGLVILFSIMQSVQETSRQYSLPATAIYTSPALSTAIAQTSTAKANP